MRLIHHDYFRLLFFAVILIIVLISHFWLKFWTSKDEWNGSENYPISFSNQLYIHTYYYLSILKNIYSVLFRCSKFYIIYIKFIYSLKIYVLEYWLVGWNGLVYTILYIIEWSRNVFIRNYIIWIRSSERNLLVWWFFFRFFLQLKCQG